MYVGDFLDIHLAVVAGAPYSPGQDTSKFQPAQHVIFGTAFSLGNGLIATAAHVAKAASNEGELTVLSLVSGREETLGSVAYQVEGFDGIDVALLYCPGLRSLPPLHVDFAPLTYFEEVQAIGFPFALEPAETGQMVLVLRAFAGHIVTRRTMYHVPGQPAGYELSFIPPPGLSGAPLFVFRNGEPRLCGMVIQNHHIEMFGKAADIGVALDIREFVRLESTIVGGSLGEKVFGLLPPA